jgi:hypothetical protein
LTVPPGQWRYEACRAARVTARPTIRIWLCRRMLSHLASGKLLIIGRR